MSVRATEHIRLKKVYVEITNVCNLSCDFCVKCRREPAFMSIGNFEKVLAGIKPFTGAVYLHVLGEPLLHTGIGDMLDLCEKYGLLASITTNASLLREASSNLLGKKMLRQINYSLHSIADDGKKYKIMDDINWFIEKTGGTVYHCLRSWNIGHGGNATPGNGIKISENVFVQRDYPFVWGDVSKEDFVFEGRCLALRHNVGILVDGTVVPCCLDAHGDIPLGNIFCDSLDKILNSERAVAMYRGFMDYKPVEKLCRTCGFLERLNLKRKKQGI